MTRVITFGFCQKAVTLRSRHNNVSRQRLTIIVKKRTWRRWPAFVARRANILLRRFCWAFSPFSSFSGSPHRHRLSSIYWLRSRYQLYKCYFLFFFLFIERRRTKLKLRKKNSWLPLFLFPYFHFLFAKLRVFHFKIFRVPVGIKRWFFLLAQWEESRPVLYGGTLLLLCHAKLEIRPPWRFLIKTQVLWDTPQTPPRRHSSVSFN